jgi:hypothetical protein
VRPFPGPGGEWQISADDAAAAGTSPTWSRTDRTLLYATADGYAMVVPYSTEGVAFRADKPRRWNDVQMRPRPRAVSGFRIFDLHPDGQHLAFAQFPNGVLAGVLDHVVVVSDFVDELRRASPTKR